MPEASAGRPGAAIAVDGYRLGVAAITAGLGISCSRACTRCPDEDETLVFFVSHSSLGDMLGTVLGERGGAPLHYLLAYPPASSIRLTSLRLVSVAFAVASMPAIAALVARLSDRRTALVATLLAAASWTTLYHGIYGRMYSLFLFTSVLSLLLLLRAVASAEAEAAGRRGPAERWRCSRPQPYGVLVLAAEVVYVAALRPAPAALAPRPAAGSRPPCSCSATPLWRTYALLGSRFDVGGRVELGARVAVRRARVPLGGLRRSRPRAGRRPRSRRAPGGARARRARAHAAGGRRPDARRRRRRGPS